MRKPASTTLRALAAGAVFVGVGLGLVFNTGLGTLSSIGYNEIAAICPLGALESIFGSWMLVPRAVIGLVAVVLLTIVFGKAFCSWLCPVPHIQNLFKTKKQRALDAAQRQHAADYALVNWREGKDISHRKVSLDTRHAVLGGALLSTAIFGFPVFCLVCPVGLSFAVFISLWRMIQFNEPSWGLVIFPIIILVEILVLRRWCLKICPMGALFSLLSSLNKTFRPHADRSRCIRDTKGSSCKACAMACPEFIDPYADNGKRPMHECVKCKSCSDACPVEAITFPGFRRKRGHSSADVFPPALESGLSPLSDREEGAARRET